MKAYKVSLIYYVDAEDEAEARQRASGLRVTSEPVGIHAIEVALRTERCSSCERTYVPSEMNQHEGESLCVTCDIDKYPEDYPGLE
jgi:hypothetical protein